MILDVVGRNKLPLGWRDYTSRIRSGLHASVAFEKLSAKHADFAEYSTRVEDDRRPTYQPNLQSILPVSILVEFGCFDHFDIFSM